MSESFQSLKRKHDRKVFLVVQPPPRPLQLSNRQYFYVSTSYCQYIWAHIYEMSDYLFILRLDIHAELAILK